MTQKLYATLRHPKMYPHTKFGIPTSKNIGDMHRTRSGTDGLTDGLTDGRTVRLLYASQSSFGGIKNSRRGWSRAIFVLKSNGYVLDILSGSGFVYVINSPMRFCPPSNTVLLALRYFCKEKKILIRTFASNLTSMKKQKQMLNRYNDPKGTLYRSWQHIIVFIAIPYCFHGLQRYV